MVLPIGDVNPSRRRAVVMGTILLANVAVFVAFNLQLEGCELIRFFYRWAAVPRELLSLQPLPPDAVPGDIGRCVAPVLAHKSVPLSIVSSMFLHANLLHLGANMLFLWVFGNNVEDELGHVAFAAFYLTGGAIAAYAFALLNPGEVTPLLGASGAIAAVLGGYLLLYPRARVLTYVPFPLYLAALLLPRARIVSWFLIFAIVDLPAWLVLGGWFAIQVTSAQQAVDSPVAYEAHVAGFVAGIFLTLLLRPSRRPPQRAPQW